MMAEAALSMFGQPPAWPTIGAGEATLEPSTPRGLLASPTPQRTHNTAHCMATPSDWGTPGSSGVVQQPLQGGTDSAAKEATTAAGASDGSEMMAAELDPTAAYA